MMPRRVPPVYSPISARALWRGLRAALSQAEADRARAELDEWVRRTYEPTEWLWTDSGTSALMLALRIAKAAGRRRVALPAYGCYDLATACDGAGVEVALYDLDPATLGPDWASLEGVLAGGADIVVVAYLYGIPVDLDRVSSLVSRFGAMLIEDAAQGVGAIWAGRPLGAHGELAVLSFGRGKGLSGGAGGLLMARGRAGVGDLPLGVGTRAGPRPLAVYAAQAILGRPSLYWLPAMLPMLELGVTKYHPPHEPLSMARSALGLLPRAACAVEAESSIRRGHAARLMAALSPQWRQGVAVSPPGSLPGYLRLPVLAPDPAQAMQADRLGRLGITRSYPLSLADLPGFGARQRWDLDAFPGSRALAQRLVTFPSHRWVDDNLAREIAMGLERP